MKETVTLSRFIEAFEKCGRGNQFSRPALQSLFEWVEGLETDTGEETELDPIAICCEWAEYENLDAVRADYPGLPEDEQKALAWLENKTALIKHEAGIVIQVF